MLSYAGGNRFLQLLGGVSMSFYDWYSDLPTARVSALNPVRSFLESATRKTEFAIAAINIALYPLPAIHKGRFFMFFPRCFQLMAPIISENW